MLVEPGAKALFPVAMPLGLQCPSTWGFLGRHHGPVFPVIRENWSTVE